MFHFEKQGDYTYKCLLLSFDSLNHDGEFWNRDHVLAAFGYPDNKRKGIPVTVGAGKRRFKVGESFDLDSALVAGRIIDHYLEDYNNESCLYVTIEVMGPRQKELLETFYNPEQGYLEPRFIDYKDSLQLLDIKLYRAIPDYGDMLNFPNLAARQI